MSKRKPALPQPHPTEKLIDHWERLLKIIDAGLISSEHAIIAVAAATRLLLESGAYLDEEGNWHHPTLRG